MKKKGDAMQEFLYVEECEIVRNDPVFLGKTLILDIDGGIRWIFDGEWTDKQVFAAIDLANNAYRFGARDGERTKAAEIRNALNIHI